MALTKDEKSQILNHFKRNELDTGSSEVQVAVLTYNIKKLTEHFQKHKKDHHSKQGLLHMVNRRRKILDYLKRKDFPKYSSLIQDLEIRK